MSSKVTFSGSARLIIVAPGVEELNVKSDLYSEWKRWIQEGDNAKYLPAFRAVGGDSTVGAQNVSPYFFLTNNWRIRPDEADHMLSLEGNLFVDGGGNPFTPTLGSYNVAINLATSVNSTVTKAEMAPEVSESLAQIEDDNVVIMSDLDTVLEDNVQLLSGMKKKPTLAQLIVMLK